VGIRKRRLVGLGQREPLSLLPVVPLASEVVVGYPVRSLLRRYDTLLHGSVPLLQALLPAGRISHFAVL